MEDKAWREYREVYMPLCQKKLAFETAVFASLQASTGVHIN